MIDTARVRGHCQRRFTSLDEVLVACHALAERPTRQLGNWTLGQICQHLGTAMELCTSADRLFPVPLYLRIVGPLLRKRVLARGLPRGFQLPPEGERLLPPRVSMDEGLVTLAVGIAALEKSSRRVPHPVFGKMTVEQWNLFHLRHAEMHLSFIVPD